MKILLVEDEPLIAKAFEEALAKAGHQVTRTSDGGEALATLRGVGSFDCIICDVVMSRMSGSEFLFEAESEKILDCPVVIVTGYPQSLCKGLPGIKVILSKPISGDVLVATVEMLKKNRRHDDK